jgi:hypothetical protein
VTTYATFIEDNEWEGETWRFYIPTDGNEVALQTLADLVEQDEPYRLDLTPIDETTVDDRVENLADDTDYLAAHTKLTGTLTVPEVDREDLLDALYKGGIADLVK